MSSDRLNIIICKKYRRRWFVAFIKSISRNIYTGDEQDHEDINIAAFQYQMKNIISLISRSRLAAQSLNNTTL
jgi:hypothetical protein